MKSLKRAVNLVMIFSLLCSCGKENPNLGRNFASAATVTSSTNTTTGEDNSQKEYKEKLSSFTEPKSADGQLQVYDSPKTQDRQIHWVVGNVLSFKGYVPNEVLENKPYSPQIDNDYYFENDSICYMNGTDAEYEGRRMMRQKDKCDASEHKKSLSSFSFLGWCKQSWNSFFGNNKQAMSGTKDVKADGTVIQYVTTNIINNNNNNICTGSICTNGNGNTFGEIINIGGGNTAPISGTRNDEESKEQKRKRKKEEREKEKQKEEERREKERKEKAEKEKKKNNKELKNQEKADEICGDSEVCKLAVEVAAGKRSTLDSDLNGMKEEARQKDEKRIIEEQKKKEEEEKNKEVAMEEQKKKEESKKLEDEDGLVDVSYAKNSDFSSSDFSSYTTYVSEPIRVENENIKMWGKFNANMIVNDEQNPPTFDMRSADNENGFSDNWKPVYAGQIVTGMDVKDWVQFRVTLPRDGKTIVGGLTIVARYKVKHKE